MSIGSPDSRGFPASPIPSSFTCVGQHAEAFPQRAPAQELSILGAFPKRSGTSLGGSPISSSHWASPAPTDLLHEITPISEHCHLRFEPWGRVGPHPRPIARPP
jgi:hypothetical protein